MRTLQSQKVGGAALIGGGLLFTFFWWGAATGGSDIVAIDAWVVQVAIHALSIGLLAYGLVALVSGSASTGNVRAALTTGAVMAPTGMAINHVLMAVGLIVVGIVKLWEKRSRLGGLGVASGGILWAAVYALGGRIGGEDNPKLTGDLRIMAFSGLLLIGAGLVALGVAQLAVADPPVTVDVPA